MNLHCVELCVIIIHSYYFFFAFCLRNTLTSSDKQFRTECLHPDSNFCFIQYAALLPQICAFQPGTHCLVVYFPPGDACILIICGFSFSLFWSDVASINASAIVRSTRNPRHPQAPFTDTDQTAAKIKVIEPCSWKRGNLSNMFFWNTNAFWLYFFLQMDIWLLL